MLGAFAWFLELIWPFIKESLLGSESFKSWLRNNVTTCIWIGLMVVMVGVVFYMADLTNAYRNATANLGYTVDVLRIQYRGLQERSLILESDLRLSRARDVTRDADMVKLQETNAVLDEKVRRYEDWMRHCGMDYQYEGSGYPVCHATSRRAMTPSHPHPKKPSNHTQDIINALRQWSPDSDKPHKEQTQ